MRESKETKKYQQLKKNVQKTEKVGRVGLIIYLLGFQNLFCNTDESNEKNTWFQRLHLYTQETHCVQLGTHYQRRTTIHFRTTLDLFKQMSIVYCLFRHHLRFLATARKLIQFENDIFVSKMNFPKG